MYLAVVIVLVLYVLIGGEFLLAIIATLGVLYILPVKHLPKLLGYLVISDVMFATWLMGIAAASLGGFQIAILTALIYALVSRELRCALGTKRIAINDELALSSQVALISSYLFAWIKALLHGIKTGKVEAPVGLTVSWIVDQEPGGFQATRTYRAFNGLWNWMTSFVTE